MNEKPPCKDCADRRAGCHAECAKYSEWHDRYLKRKRDSWENPGDKAAWELLQSGARKCIKRNPKKR